MTTKAVTPPAPARKRGSETARDMVLSLAACMALVIPVWFLAQPPPSASKSLRVVETATDIQALQAAVPGVPAPAGLSAGWRPTSSTLDGPALRIGYVTPGEEYAEYAARSGDPESFLLEQTGRGRRTGQLTVGGSAFEVWSNSDGHTSLVLRRAGSTVVLGGLRETADDSELQELAASLRQG